MTTRRGLFRLLAAAPIGGVAAIVAASEPPRISPSQLDDLFRNSGTWKLHSQAVQEWERSQK